MIRDVFKKRFFGRALLAACWLLVSGTVFSQVNLKGMVLREDGVALEGATVLIRGAERPRDSIKITNNEGRFLFSGLKAGSGFTFLVSMAGYENYIVKGMDLKEGEENSVLVRMKTNGDPLNEVVVVGYGTQQRRNVTSSISSIKRSAIADLPVSSFTEALTGQIPGVQVSTVDGEPGRAVNVRIRGTGSITAGNNPLYVVDGFPLDVEAFSSLNMSDIESIEVLKDASATSIYGSRGANGVVMVTTRRGSSGKMNVRFNTYRGVQRLSKKVDVLSPEEYVELAIEAIQYSWTQRGGSPDDPNSARSTLYQIAPYFLVPENWTRTDWQDEIYQTAPISDHNISITGGSEKTKFLASIGYFDQDGILLNTGFKRYSGRLNLDGSFSEKARFTIGFAPGYAARNTVLGSGRWTDGAVGSALAIPGFFPVRNEDGSYPSYHGFGYNSSAVYNPVSLVQEARGREHTLRLLTNASVSLDLWEGLTYKLNGGMDYSAVDASFYKSTLLPSGIDPGGSARSSFNTNWALENTLSYKKYIGGDHEFGFLLGQSAQAAQYRSSNLSAVNYPNDLVQTLNAGQLDGGSSSESEWTLASYFFRMNYAFRDKYFLNAAIRKDGSSRFGNDRKWGQFPSVSAGWLVSEEDFLKRSAVINQLKLRSSYGLTGNNAISNYGAIGLLNGVEYVFGNTIVNGQYQQTFSNRNLGWENARMFDIGLDIGMFNNRVSFIYDFYDKVNEDLLLDVPVPSISGTTTTLTNIGRVRNRGMELAITSQNLQGKLNWTTTLNVSYNRNEVLELGPGGDPIITNGMATMQGTHITQVGSPIGSFYGFVFEGIYNTMDEISKRPHLTTDRPGDPIIRDVNGDGEIDMDDRTIIGNNMPDYIFGFDNTLRYKNFDLRVLVHGVQGMEILNLTKHGIGIMHGRLNQLGEARNRWRSPEEPGNGEVFRASLDINGYRRLASTYYMEDASFVRLKNITLGYSFPPAWMSRMGMSSARLYLSAQNPVTWTSYQMYNPEASQNNYNNPLTPGSDMDVYPLAKTFSVGLNVNF